MNYRIIMVTLLAIAITPLGLAAQPPGGAGFGDDWGQGRAERGQSQRIEHLIEFLELSDAQAIEIEELMGEQRAARRAAAQTMRADGDALRALIESERPDPTLVGQGVLAMHGAREAMRQQGEADLGAIRGLLTPNQAEKFDALMAAREMGRDRGERAGKGRRGHRSGRPGQGRPPGDG